MFAKLFNHRKTRKVLVQFRVLLGIIGYVVLLTFAQPTWFWPAFAVAVVGEAFQLWCFASLNKQQDLAYNGLYKHVRNPMYLGRFLLVVGYVLLLANTYVLVFVVPVYILYMWHRVQREERKLKVVLGEPYLRYQRHVNRFLPAIKGMPGGIIWFWSWRLFRQNHGWLNGGVVFVSFAVVYTWLFIFGVGGR